VDSGSHDDGPCGALGRQLVVVMPVRDGFGTSTCVWKNEAGTMDGRSWRRYKAPTPYQCSRISLSQSQSQPAG
jgi:hypothetical protein